MLKILPHTALRTLESVVRLQGFGRAAEELNVTQSAVSQHVKSLEEWIGHKLLIRGARRTVATAEGARLAAAVADGFNVIEAACAELRESSQTSNKRLLVASLPGFTYVWLLPRLLNFDLAFPEITISLSTDINTQLGSVEESDVMIHYGLGGFAGLHAEHLMGETLSPVCAPGLRGQLRDIGDLANQTILMDDVQNVGNPPTWDFWAEEAGIRLPKLLRTRQFGQANMVVQAAIKGVGVAMGRSPLVTDAIRDGTLVQPFPQVVKSQFSYWFVCRHEALKSKSVRAFRDWLHDEAAASASLP